uniref:C-type lectin domain-containing protein n=1 Tax=Chromera velia CCMP2878 TaxID=1169474 RepID=A0A0G4GBH1_9ALVE|eukprot:Cvel_4458.t1-p1 / transcript=Cvel_4458.t1 / gene=Cvel_4458 / organism=Chromera_velia_CCMP2878 / gene_product=Perlucin-like protein, putative / transcript_product=Perlucin-like protein, putative / location=Cvel_scaffold194:106977-117242(+) / protein_length=1388 / sequence_SO=supercontig / SO=protein_coding / is_pseudo=false
MRRFGTFLTLLGLSSCLVLKSHAHRVHGHRTPWLPWYTKEKEIAKPGVIAPHEDSPQLVQPGRSSASRFGVSLPTDNLTKFEGCPATSSTSFNTDRQRRTAVSHPHASSDVSSEKDEGDNLVTVGARRSSAACGAGQVPLSEVGFGSAPKVTCCPADKLECAGCSSFANGACAKCLPGYVKQCAAGKDTCGPVVCTACSDIPGYTDSDGKSCSQLCPATPKLFSQTEKNAFVAKATGGLTAMDACCACGGGLRDPTPWAYNDDVDFVLGKPVKVTPMPRTATAYAPDGCELEKYGLSLDPVTGVIEGSPLATEPFSLECKVTALQSPELGISYNATMKVRVLPFAYGRANLLLGSAALPVVSSRTYNAGKFGIKCSPTVSWLDQTGFAQAGQIKLAAEAGVKTGGLAGTAIETTASEHLKGVNSTLTGSLLVEKPSTRCHLTAERNAPTKGGKTTVMTDAADMVLIRSAPWTDIVYPVPFPAASPLLLTVGKPVEAPKILRPTDAAGNRNTMPPAFFTISCALKGTTTAVTEHVARTHEVNFVTASKSRIPLFTMDPVSGEIGGATSSKANGGWELPFKYVDAAQRGLVELECKIFGSELTASKPTGPAGPLPTSAWLAASKTVSITVQDDSCWQDVQVKSDSVFLTAYTQASAHQSLEACRRTCGTDASCALFNFSSNKCYKGRRSSKPGAARAALIDVQAKLSACDPSKTCKALEVQGHAWLSGTFCPVVRDFTAGSFMFAYQKTGFTPQDATYLYPYVAAREGTPAPCPAGSKWIVRQASGGDFLDPEGGQFTFRGRLLACLPPENTKGKWATGTGSIYMPPDFTKTSSKFLISMTPQICKSPLADLANAQSKDAQGAQQGQSAAAEEQTGGAPAGGGSPGEVYRIHDPDIEGPTGAASHWLDPCECFPVEWGPNAPVNPQVFSMLPRDGVNKIPKLTAKPQLIVKGSVTCMWKDLLSSFPTDSEEECSAKCREAAQCNFFWVGTMGAAPQCRLFSVCDALMSEPGNEQEMVSGALFGLPRYDVCLMADPQACAARTKRRKYLTSDDAESVSAPSFRVLCERFTKAEASHACKAQGMILAQVTSPLQNDWAVTALSSLCSAVTPWGWIDGSDAGHEGTWKFSDGTPQVYNNYNAGEPNGRTTENCNLLNVNSKWYDITCSYGGAAAVCMNTPKRLKAVCQSTTPNAAAAKCHAVGMKVATISTTADLENAQTVLASQCAGANGVAVIDGTNEGGGVAEYYTSDARTWSAPRWKAGHPKAGGGHCARLNVDGMESTPCTTASPAVLCQHDLSGLAFLPQSATAQLSSWDANHDKRGLSFKAPPLHHAWAWCGKFGGHGWHEWVEIGMPKAMWVSAIATRGRADWDQWVTAYRVEYLEAGGFVKVGR